MKLCAIACIVTALFVNGCSKPNSSATSIRGTTGGGYMEEQPHTNTGTGGIGSGPTGTGGGEPADVNPATR
ncbi:MAG TPA: hypothetical protein VFI31_19410 [Pirellulales bacterium]|nr:hypothetical protein [Pirellulales bacterium]